MLNKKIYLISILALAALGGCGQAEMGATEAASKMPAVEGSNPPIQSAAYERRDIIRSAILSIRVPDVEKQEKSTRAIVNGSGGFIETSETTNLDDATPQVTMLIRVPSARFDQVLESIEALGKRLTKRISTEDVTGQLVDYEARLRIMKAQEESFRTMLRKSGESSAALDLHTRIMRLREDIESLQAQRKALAGRAQMSKIELTLTNETKAIGAGDEAWFKEAWTGATNALSFIGKGLGRFAIILAVFSPIWGPMAWGVALWRRRPAR